MTFERTVFVPAPVDEVFAFFSDAKNLATLTPPKMRLTFTTMLDGPPRPGDRISYRLRVFGVPIRWTTRFETWRHNESFSDAQERGPYKSYMHTHTFRAVNGGTEMHDHIEYELPLGILGRLFGGGLVARELGMLFDYREKQIARIFT